MYSEMRPMNPDNYGEEKHDKSTELNPSMTLESGQPDSFTAAVHTLSGSGGGN